MHPLVSIVLVVLFLLMNAFFVVAEFSIVRVRRSQLEVSIEQGKKGAKRALYVAQNVNAYLSACQLGITLASLALGWLGEPAFSELIRPLFVMLGLPEAAISVAAVAVGYIIMTTLHVVAGELIPKSFAIFSTEKYALLTATPLHYFYRLTYPVMWVFNHITNFVVRLAGHDPANEHEVYTGEEIKLLIDESTESGLIDPEQNEFVDNIFDLGDKDAEAIMTPRTDLVCLDLEDSLEENLETIRQYRYSRYPICRGTKDHIVGFVHMKDLYGVSSDTPLEDWNIREMPAVPETMSIARLLETLQAKRTEICLVVDEHGGTAGIVTMSDVMEQIVGRIDDEYRHDLDNDVVEIGKDAYLVDGALPMSKLEEIIGFEPEESDEVETAGGLLLALFDRIPAEGDTVALDGKSTHVTFTVREMDRLRIDRIEMKIEREDPEELEA